MWRQIGGQPSAVANEDEEIEEEEDPVSTHFNTNKFGNFLEVHKDKLTVQYRGQGAHNNDVGAIQGNRPVPRRRRIYYYEVLVSDGGERGLIGIGFADKDFKMGKQPGWEPNSYGYHGDDGKRFHANGHGDDYGPTFGAGDVIGAGIHLQRQEIFFTKNGKHLGVAFKNITTVPLYPTIGLHSPGECVTVNFGQQPFKFNVEGMLQEYRDQEEAEVQSIEIPAGVTHRLVRNYLLHHGYAGTLAAFDNASGANAGAEISTSSRSEAESAATATLAVRQAIRQHMMAGRIDAVNALLKQHAPDLILDNNKAAKPDLDVHFYLNCMQFIELIRENKIEEAVHVAQSGLAPLRGLLSHKNRTYDAMLHDVIALLAYEKPLESPLAGLLDPAQREAAADVINASLLAHATSSSSEASATEPKPQAALERLLQQLVAVQAELLECNGGFGEPFRLRRHLLPPPHKPQSNGATPMERD